MSTQRQINFETSINEFLALATECKDRRPISVNDILPVFMNWYARTRITEALEKCHDMVLLQWGDTRDFTFVDEAVDLRRRDRSMPRDYILKAVPYIGMTRQVFPAAGEDSIEFDDAAVQMTLMLGYADGPTTGTCDNMWIDSPQDIAAGIEEFRSKEFVASLFHTPAHRCAGCVDYCG